MSLFTQYNCEVNFFYLILSSKHIFVMFICVTVSTIQPFYVLAFAVLSTATTTTQQFAEDRHNKQKLDLVLRDYARTIICYLT